MILYLINLFKTTEKSVVNCDAHPSISSNVVEKQIIVYEVQ